MPKPDPTAPLRTALAMHDAGHVTQTIAAAIKSAVRDALPGRQQKRNLEPILAKAMKAAVRTIRRRARS